MNARSWLAVLICYALTKKYTADFPGMEVISYESAHIHKLLTSKIWKSPFCVLEIPSATIPPGRSVWERQDNGKGAFSQVGSRDNWGSSAQEHLGPRGKKTSCCSRIAYYSLRDSSPWQAGSQAKLDHPGDPSKSETTKKGSMQKVEVGIDISRRDVETLTEHAKMWLWKVKPTWNETWRGMSRHQEELPQVQKQKKEDWGNLSPLFN